MYISLMESAGKTVGGLPFGEIVLCGERSHGQYPPQKEMRILPEFVLVYLFEGSGIYQDANHETIELAAGSCLLIPPKLPHTYHPHSPDEQETSGCDHGLYEGARTIPRAGGQLLWRSPYQLCRLSQHLTAGAIVAPADPVASKSRPPTLLWTNDRISPSTRSI